MSVAAKMTAIADNIRSLLGISGKLGLDAMATNLGTERTNIDSAFAAVGNKGGTVPSSKVSGNLAAAIASIPAGAAVQRKADSFTTDGSGGATVNCGFKPDVVYIKGDRTTEDGVTAENSQAIVFSEDTRSNLCTAMYNNEGVVEAFWTRSDSGFSANMTEYNWDWEASAASGMTFNYVAIKYT